MFLGNENTIELVNITLPTMWLNVEDLNNLSIKYLYNGYNGKIKSKKNPDKDIKGYVENIVNVPISKSELIDLITDKVDVQSIFKGNMLSETTFRTVNFSESIEKSDLLEYLPKEGVVFSDYPNSIFLDKLLTEIKEIFKDKTDSEFLERIDLEIVKDEEIRKKNREKFMRMEFN